MIVGFKFKNYRSYPEEAEFSLVAQESDFNPESVTEVRLEDGSRLRLLNVAAIFGANASGKSNVIHLLGDLSEMVRDSLLYTPGHRMPLRLYYKFDSESGKLPTEVSVDFVVKGRRYVYSLRINDSCVEDEKLDLNENDSLLNVYHKYGDNGKYKLEVGDGWKSSSLDLSEMHLLQNQLILSWMATKESNGLQYVADFLANLTVSTPDSSASLKKSLSEIAEKYFEGGKSGLYDKFTKLMSIADLGVIGAEFHRHNDSDFKFPQFVSEEIRSAFIKENRWEFKLLHESANNGAESSLPLDYESEGTRALIALAPRILYALENGLFLAYDEISTAIHPELMQLLVKMFQNKRSNPKGAQLIFTTHDASVADRETLRADQIWFVEKKEGRSDLYSAQDFSDISINIPFDRWYRSGRFGALPSFGSINYIFGDGTEKQNDKQ